MAGGVSGREGEELVAADLWDSSNCGGDSGMDFPDADL